MNKLSVVLLLGLVVASVGREPFKPTQNSAPFLVYYASRYRGMCVGTLVSRAAVLTAAVCVTDPTSAFRDTRPVTVITGTKYRHPRRGIRVPVRQILLPRLSNVTANRGYLMQKSAAMLMLKHRVPDALVETPLRAMPVDWRGEEDMIYPVHKFLLQRTARAQFLNIVKRDMWCGTLSIKFEKALTNMGFFGYFDKTGTICVKDPDRGAQPCHGMYGAPLVCRGKLVALMLAPDAQWTNCTGMSNLVHLVSGRNLHPFMRCVRKLFDPDVQPDWASMKKSLMQDDEEAHYDYLPAMYAKLSLHSHSESSEDTHDDEFV